MPALRVLSHLHGATRSKMFVTLSSYSECRRWRTRPACVWWSVSQTLVSVSRKILALRESLDLARSRSISDTAQRKWVRQGAYAQFQPHPRWEFNFCCSAKEISQIYYMHGYKFSGGNTGIYSRIWPGNNAVITSLPSKRFICTHHT